MISQTESLRKEAQKGRPMVSQAPNMNLNMMKANKLVGETSLQDIDAYSSEKVSKKGSSGGAAPNSLKHHESISTVSSATATKSKGKKNLTSLSEIEKQHLGITSVASKKNFSGQKHSGGRGTSGSIDFHTGTISSSNLIKTRSILGQKVSEVTVQANHLKKSQQPSFTSSVSSKQFAIGAKSGALLAGLVMTPQKFKVKNATQTTKKNAGLKNQKHSTIYSNSFA